MPSSRFGVKAGDGQDIASDFNVKNKLQEVKKCVKEEA